MKIIVIIKRVVKLTFYFLSCSTTIDLSKLERETTHKIKHKLVVDDGNDDRGGDGDEKTGDHRKASGGSGRSIGVLYLLLTISGTSTINTVSDLSGNEQEITEQEHIRERYSASRTFRELRDIGILTVRVYRAQGLTSADLCGKSDPFCVLELVNTRLQTHTEYKTLSPTWDKIFTLWVYYLLWTNDKQSKIKENFNGVPTFVSSLQYIKL